MYPLVLLVITALVLIGTARSALNGIGNPTARDLSRSDRISPLVDRPRVIVLPDVMPDDWRNFYATARTDRAREIAELEALLAL